MTEGNILLPSVSASSFEASECGLGLSDLYLRISMDYRVLMARQGNRITTDSLVGIRLCSEFHHQGHKCVVFARFKYFMCVDVFPAWMSVHHRDAAPTLVTRGHWIPLQQMVANNYVGVKN